MKVILVSLSFILSIILICAPTQATETTTTLYPSGDTYLTGDGHNNDNFGSNTILKVQHQPMYAHDLVKFSQSQIVSAVTTGTVTSAKLRLYIETNFNNWGSGTNIDVHRLTNDWDEAGVTWLCYPSDTNLENTNPNCATQWSGGTYATPETATMLQGNITGWVEFDVKSDVQAFLTGTANYGWLLRKRSTTAGSLQYTSREGTSANRPQLVLTVQPPVPPNQPPVPNCSADREPNEHTWYDAPVTIDCSPTDPDGDSVTCAGVSPTPNPPVTVATDCQNQSFTFECTDSRGASDRQTVTVSIDMTDPQIEITVPEDNSKLGVSEVTATGTVSNDVSEVSCNGIPGSVTDGTFSCTVQFQDGPNTLEALATDNADNSGSDSVSLSVLVASCSQQEITSLSPEMVSLATPTTISLAGFGLDAVSTVAVDGMEVPFVVQTSQSLTFEVNFEADGNHQVLISSICVDDSIHVANIVSGAGGTQPLPLIVKRVGLDHGVLSEGYPSAYLDSTLYVLPTNEVLTSSSVEFLIKWSVTGEPTIDLNHSPWSAGPYLSRIEKPFEMVLVRGPDGNNVNYIVAEPGTPFVGKDAFGVPIPNNRYQMSMTAALLRHTIHESEWGQECDLGYDDAEEIASGDVGSGRLAFLLDTASLNTETSVETDLRASHCLPNVNCAGPFTFEELSSDTDDWGYRYSRYAQYYNGIPVQGGYVEVVADTISGDNQVIDSTEYDAAVNTNPALTELVAVGLAQNDLDVQVEGAFIDQGIGDLVIYPDSTGTFHLAYSIKSADDPSSLSGSTSEVIDALDGAVLERFIDQDFFAEEEVVGPPPTLTEDCIDHTDAERSNGLFRRRGSTLRYGTGGANGGEPPKARLLGYSDYFVVSKGKPNQKFNFNGYFENVQPFVNLQRIWISGYSGVTGIPELFPFNRNSEGTYQIKSPVINPPYFDRLRAVLQSAKDQGQIVELTLFDGWSLEKAGKNYYYPKSFWYKQHAG